MELLGKKLTERGPEISVHPVVTLSLSSFFLLHFFREKNMELYDSQETNFCTVLLAS